MDRRLARRDALRAAAGAAALIPLGATAPLRRAAAPDPLAGTPICRLADTAPPAAKGPLTKLKLTWNANAICTVGVPVAESHGIFGVGAWIA